MINNELLRHAKNDHVLRLLFTVGAVGARSTVKMISMRMPWNILRISPGYFVFSLIAQFQDSFCCVVDQQRIRWSYVCQCWTSIKKLQVLVRFYVSRRVVCFSWGEMHQPRSVWLQKFLMLLHEFKNVQAVERILDVKYSQIFLLWSRK